MKPSSEESVPNLLHSVEWDTFPIQSLQMFQTVSVWDVPEVSILSQWILSSLIVGLLKRVEEKMKAKEGDYIMFPSRKGQVVMNRAARLSGYSCLIGLCVFAFCGIDPAEAQNQADKFVAPVSGRGLKTGLFELCEMDMHLHAGMERELPLDEWIEFSVKNGRKVLVLLDHLELYRMNPKRHAEWVEKNGFTDWYPVGTEGHAALMEDFAQAEKRDDVITFRGWEIYEGELDGRLEAAPMKLAEVIGWHISPNNGGPPPNGQTLLKRTRQIISIQEQFPVPMILFHPFSMRIENIMLTAQKTGRDLASISVEEYQFFQPGEQAELIELIQGRSIYIEIPWALTNCWENDVLRQALINDIRPLVEGGVQFTVSTDAHGVRSLKQPFNPRYYCDDLGVTPANTNTIVRELLAIRARSTLKSHSTE